MRVLFDDRRATFAPHTGIGRYSALCLSGLQGRDGVELVRATAVAPRLASSGINERAWLRKLAIDQVVLLARSRRVDVYHALWHESSPLTRPPLVVSVYDMSVQRDGGAYSRPQRMYYGSLLRALLARARIVLVPSKTTADDIDAWRPGTPIRVVTFPIDPVFLEPEMARPPATDGPSAPTDRRPYLLYTGGLHARKDLATLLRGVAAAQASGAFDGPLVVTGPNNRAFVERARSLHCMTTTTGVLPAVALRTLYRGAAAVVSASFNEGFGYSAAEALASGKPIVCPSSGALPETGGSAAVTFEPGDVDGLAGAILGAVNPDPALVRAIEHERSNAQHRFSVQRAAADLQTCYQLAAS
jgi:glycosyltransferase involved in cell wall biosynthesis